MPKVTGWATEERGHRLMATIPSNLSRFKQRPSSFLFFDSRCVWLTSRVLLIGLLGGGGGGGGVLFFLFGPFVVGKREEHVLREVVFGEVSGPDDARARHAAPARHVDQLVPGGGVQRLVVDVREDVLVPLGVVPVQAHLVRAAVRPAHVRVVHGRAERARQKPADERVVDLS